ncbi:MAG: sigma-70 family RNA polymerase sigma factor [Cyclobacteriaceae bacterium]
MKFEARKGHRFSALIKPDLPQKPVSDEVLWINFCEGDQGAFAQIYRDYVNDLYNFGFQLSRDEDISKDIIHDVFVKLRFSKSRSKIKSIKSYLFRCIYTEWIKRSKSTSVFSSLSDDFAITLSFEDGMVEKQMGVDRQKYLEKALNELTNKQRRAVMLFFYENMSYSEVAEGMALKNAKSARKLIYRALERIKPDQAAMKILYSFLL